MYLQLIRHTWVFVISSESCFRLGGWNVTVQERREQKSQWSWNYAPERRTVEGTRVSVVLKRCQTGSKSMALPWDSSVLWGIYADFWRHFCHSWVGATGT